MLKLNYCVVSPVKKYSAQFEEWLDHVKKFKPSPDEIIICSENDFPKSNDYTFLKNEIAYVPKKFKGLEHERHYRIGYAREVIRRYVIDETSHNLILSLDSDVFCLNDYSPLILAGLMNLTQSSVLVNEITSTSGYPPISLGCLMISRDIYELSCFMPYGNYSEDSIFYVTLNNLLALGYNFKVVYGRILPVKHIKEGEVFQIPEPDLDLKVLQRLSDQK
jgi:hypothetical protein